MMEQKPVAIQDIMFEVFSYAALPLDENSTERVEQIKALNKQQLLIRTMISDQLKAERDKTIRECADIASKWESYDFDTYDICTPSVKILQLLSTNESKENEEKTS